MRCNEDTVVIPGKAGIHLRLAFTYSVPLAPTPRPVAGPERK